MKDENWHIDGRQHGAQRSLIRIVEVARIRKGMVERTSLRKRSREQPQSRELRAVNSVIQNCSNLITSGDDKAELERAGLTAS